ncbi:MAG: ribosome silencing factor [Candidatus Carbobacillus altaicus]|nr:ribosome silencing factor [Candidatus Carbobacillus altaicus]
MHAPYDAEQLAKELAQAIETRKGVDTRILNIQNLSLIADYFVITSGTSKPHVDALTETALDLLNQKGLTMRRVEGKESGRWVLIDAGDVVVHIFHKDERSYYQLERIWSDAPVLSLT